MILLLQLAHAFIRSISSDNTYYLTLRNVMELAWIGRDKSRQLVTSKLLSFIEFSRVVGSLITQWDKNQRESQPRELLNGVRCT